MDHKGPEAERDAVLRLLASPSYIKAYEDVAFFKRDELRPVRLQVELLKAELVQQEQGILSTIVVFGSARSPSPEAAARAVQEARARVDAAPDDATAMEALGKAEKRLEHSNWYR